jgi:hypothetical protein
LAVIVSRPEVDPIVTAVLALVKLSGVLVHEAGGAVLRFEYVKVVCVPSLCVFVYW